MKRAELYIMIVLVLLLSTVSLGIRNYEIDKVIYPGLDNQNHFGLAYNPILDHLFLGRGSGGGLGYLTEIDLDGNVINDYQLGVGTYDLCYVNDLSYDNSTGHLFALITTQKDNIYGQRIWEMGTDLQTIYNDISLQEVMQTSSFQGFQGLQIKSEAIWATNWSEEIIHLSRDFNLIETKPTPAWIKSLASSPDGGLLGLEYSPGAGERCIYEFDNNLDHISITGVNAAFNVSTTYGIWNIETYQNKMFLSNNNELYILSAQIPEPATVLLLGLSGWALVRKRR